MFFYTQNSKKIKKIAWRNHKWSKRYVFSSLCVFFDKKLNKFFFSLSTCASRMENRFVLKIGIPRFFDMLFQNMFKKI